MRRSPQVMIFTMILFAIAVMTARQVRADSAANPDGWAPGYLSDVSGEQADSSQDFVILPPPAPKETTKLYDKIFTDKLKRDIIDNYRKTFGYTEYEQIQMASNQFGDAQSDLSNRLMPMDQYIAEQKSFGQYMLNAMAEYHIDNYFKHSASLKQVYAAQKKLSKIEYQAKDGAKLKMKYDIASGAAIITYNKPHDKFHKQLDVQVSGQANTVLKLDYDLNHRVNLESDLQFEDEIMTLTATRHYQGNLSTNVSLQSINREVDMWTPPQNRILLGLSWND